MRKLKWMFALLLALMSFGLQAAFEEGKHYQRLSTEITENKLVKEFSQTNKDKTIQVIEFFSYGCGWCFKLDPDVEKWGKHASKEVSFTRVPVEFQPTWKTLGKAYYVAMTSNAFNKIHPALFKAVYDHQMLDTSEETLQKFFAQKDIDEKKFTASFNSDEIVKKQKWANMLSRAYRITVVPAFVVQGKAGTFVTNMQLAGDEKTIFQVLDYLVEMQRKAK